MTGGQESADDSRGQTGTVVNPRADEARQRLRQRVDELVGKCNQAADQKRRSDAPSAKTPENSVILQAGTLPVADRREVPPETAPDSQAPEKPIIVQAGTLPEVERRVVDPNPAPVPPAPEKQVIIQAGTLPLLEGRERKLEPVTSRQPAEAAIITGTTIRPATERREALSTPAPDEQGEPVATSHRALVVEGNPLHRKVLVVALEKSGFEVDAVDSSEEAIGMFQRRPFGIVLLDCDTPEINGFRTAASMRMIEGEVRHTPIVGLTGNAGQSHRMERKAAGIDNYLLKPFRRDRVEAVVSRYAPIRELRPAPQLLSLDKDRVREIQELACDDPALLSELIDLFLTGTPDLIDQMRRAVEDEDGPALRRAAHTLKGSSGQMGALRIQDICATIETLAGTGSLVGVEPLLSELSVAFARAVAELRSLSNGVLPSVDETGDTGTAAKRPPKDAAKSNEILVAEDDMLIGRFLSSSLTAAGFHVTHVRDGRAAMDAAHVTNFAAIILDINMPEMDGYQVLSEIRATVGDNTPVAIISSRHQEQDILRAFDLGVDDYLTKPFNPSEVVARIRRLVRQASTR